MLRDKRKLISIIGACVLVAAAAVFFVFYYGAGGNKTDYWPDNPPDAETVKTASWKPDLEQIYENEYVISISPSGKYILAANQRVEDPSRRMRTGKNQKGYIISYVALYENKDGELTLVDRIDIDADADPELNDTLVTCPGEAGVAWLGDDPRLCVSTGRGAVWTANGDIFLIDFAEKSVENLTGRGYDTADLLPQWNGKDSVYFIRHMIDEEKMARVRLMSLDISTGELLVIADLSQDGIPAIVLDYAVYDGTVYYSLNSNSSERTGLYKAALGGGEQPIQLLNVLDIKKSNTHPYIRWFSSVEISQDGRYLCLTVIDTRYDSWDFPLVDHSLTPQSDPSDAKSLVTHSKWIPCHNVLLYDLRIKELVDPFTDAALQPHVVLATAATFAPDGKSLLCAVLFDGGPWTAAAMTATTLYQIRLDSSTFDTMRIYTTGIGALSTGAVPIGAVPMLLSWHGDNSIQITPLTGKVTLVTPAAYEGLAK